jgi:hypothetical protein
MVLSVTPEDVDRVFLSADAAAHAPDVEVDRVFLAPEEVDRVFLAPPLPPPAASFIAPPTQNRKRPPPFSDPIESDSDLTDSENHECNSCCGCSCVRCPQEHDPTKKEQTDKQRAALRKKMTRGISMTQQKRLDENVMQGVVKKCTSCTKEKSCCKSVHFAMVKAIRQEIYASDPSDKATGEWLFYSILRCFEANVGRKGKGIQYSLVDDTRPAPRTIDVCRECFVNVTGFSNETVAKVHTRIVQDGQRIYSCEKAPKSTAGSSAEWNHIHVWISMYTNGLLCHSPDQKRSELPNATTRKMMWEAFALDWDAGVINGVFRRSCCGRMKLEKKDSHPAPLYQTFCKVWTKDFADKINIPGHHKRFAMCNWCAELKSNLTREKDPTRKAYWKQKLFRHYEWVTLQRRKYYKHRKKAIDFPEK